MRKIRKTLVFSCVFALVAASRAGADEATRQRLIHFFGGWYSWYPNSMIRVSGTREVEIPGFEVYRVERSCESKYHQESNVVLFDAAKDDIFVGEVFHDLPRRMAKRPFDAAADVPLIEGSLTEGYGLPVKVKLEDVGARGTLKPITLTIRHTEKAPITVGGFVSTDGATLLIGEFHPLASDAQAVRRKLLEETPGIRMQKGRFTVAEFIDFQCERCRQRAPEVKRFVSAQGGAVDVHLLPLTRVHDWAFPAAEYAAALANVDPALYAKFEERMFDYDTPTGEVVRDLASDIAEAAGAKEKYQAELSSGRARDRVARDIRLAIRLGLSGTPSFLHEGNFVSGERDLFESYLREKIPPVAAPAKPAG